MPLQKSPLTEMKLFDESSNTDAEDKDDKVRV